ncbi:MAG: hypothetical protein LVS60_02165 [Nodosilinea sp. LVE1205-7]
MADQLDIFAAGQIVPTSLHAEVQRSYLEYAMSVIVGRALPDVRDGLNRYIAAFSTPCTNWA